MLGAVLLGCAPQITFGLIGADVPGRVEQSILVANVRRGVPDYARFGVSLPEDRDTGVLRYSGSNAFRISDLAALSTDGFMGAIADVEPPQQPIALFVHGYNTTMTEAVFRHAQMARDFQEAGPQVTFAWPSIGSTFGYVADRDAALRSRDALDRLLTQLIAEQDRPILLVGYSMGGFLVMETLRQMALRGALPRDRIEAVVLISPDVDIDLFRTQMAAIGQRPWPFVVIINRDDRVLSLASSLAGQRPRLGSPRDISLLEGLDITVADLTATEGGERNGHLQAMSSAQAIDWLSAVSGLVERRAPGSGLTILRPFGG
ncbi:hypothetical protein JANAI62_21790 [Jannaschia pagri]|uniref:Esterase/lipase superfamily enzyme n=1 Tax=Jannaschia pagri TaxID=2829797 RepID=A0ABQ4NMB8_9RHOB|nr:hypothetical protein JANAI61_21800 [Jannaschia sp. AI_61]GIT95556.1 hypothetical protein JANAI62_21790 [Jannaschia sp. AI_62]